MCFLNFGVKGLNGLKCIIECHVFVRFSSSGIGTFLKKIEGPLEKKRSKSWGD